MEATGRMRHVPRSDGRRSGLSGKRAEPLSETSRIRHPLPGLSCSGRAMNRQSSRTSARHTNHFFVYAASPCSAAAFGARPKRNSVYGNRCKHAPTRIPQGLAAVYEAARSRASCVVSFGGAPASSPGRFFAPPNSSHFGKGKRQDLAPISYQATRDAVFGERRR